MTGFKRTDAILLIFIAICLGLAVFSWASNWDSDEFSADGTSSDLPESGFTSFFKSAHYFKLEDSKPMVHLNASQLSMNSRSK